jgi:hypothetical protein
MKTKLRWARRLPNSTSNFDLILLNPQDLDPSRLTSLLEGILSETHRNLTLSGRAANEFRRWIDSPTTPLKSIAYVLLSNWFTTRSGDRNSMVASRCEALWDELFPCRLLERLSSPEPGQNHVILPSEFSSFWQEVLKAQGEDPSEQGGLLSEPNVEQPSEANHVCEDLERSQTGDLSEANADSTSDRLTAKFDNNGLHFEVAGSPQALANFLRVYGGKPDLSKQSK